MADSPAISVLKLLLVVSQNFCKKLQHVITHCSFFVTYVVCMIFFSEVLLGLGLIGFKNRSSMRVPIM